MIDCNGEMKSFHDDEVNLSESLQAKLRGNRDANRDRIKAGLQALDEPEPVKFCTQGSYEMRTMVQMPSHDFDIDDGIYFLETDLDESGSVTEPADARALVARAARQNTGSLLRDPRAKKNCVRIWYSEGHHVDVPVYRLKGDVDEGSRRELSSGDEWFSSDAESVTSWFNSKVPGLDQGQYDRCQMRRVVRLTKKLARSRSDWIKKTTSGIAITKLVVDAYEDIPEREDMALRECWIAIESVLSESLAVHHPTEEGVLLSKGGNDSKVEFLRSKLEWACKELEVLDKDDCTKEQALDVWDRIFGTSYFSRQEEGESGPGSIFKNRPDSDRPVRRRDGGRQYG